MSGSGKSYKVLLVKANWCGHCTTFFPIFSQANKEIGNHTDKNIEFISYDTATKDLIYHHKDDKDDDKDDDKYDDKDKVYIKKSENQETYPYEKKNNNEPEVKGFPTIFLVIVNNDNTFEKKPIENRGTKPTEFINSVLDTIKTFESDGKIEYIHINNDDDEDDDEDEDEDENKKQTIMVGGNRNYESKYLKYKSKYLELKKNLNK
jgi:thiol-disulfide isomerase/thioredoxin